MEVNGPVPSGAVATQAERRAATTSALLRAAAERFGSDGYDATSIDRVAAAAGVTKGALYHHFAGGKEALFRQVFEDAEAALAARCAEAALAEPGDDPLARLRAATRTFLESCLDPATRRIVLVDGPAVLGWEAWREVDERHFLGGVRLALETAMASGQLRRRPVDPLAHLLMGALTEAAMTVARADDPQAALRDVVDEVDNLLRGLA